MPENEVKRKNRIKCATGRQNVQTLTTKVQSTKYIDVRIRFEYVVVVVVDYGQWV